MINLDHITHFRAEIDQFLARHPQSPLSEAQLDGFEGLSYFDPDPAFIFEVEVERFPADEPTFEMETSTGDRRAYRRWGKFAFAVDGETAELVIYSDVYGESLFLPFKDRTNGRSTYGAGRYLDDHRPGLRRLGGDRLEVDFNLAYNPYCAYSPLYSCPLPPRENWLEVEIRAGEQAFE